MWIAPWKRLVSAIHLDLDAQPFIRNTALVRFAPMVGYVYCTNNKHILRMQ